MIGLKTSPCLVHYVLLLGIIDSESTLVQVVQSQRIDDHCRREINGVLIKNIANNTSRIDVDVSFQQRKHHLQICKRWRGIATTHSASSAPPPVCSKPVTESNLLETKLFCSTFTFSVFIIYSRKRNSMINHRPRKKRNGMTQSTTNINICERMTTETAAEYVYTSMRV